MEVQNAIERTIRHPEMGSKHFARPNGSALTINGSVNRTHQAALDVLGSVGFTDVTDQLKQGLKAPVEGVRYFRFSFPEGITAMQAVSNLGDLTDEQLSTVRVRRAEHQDEHKDRVEFISDAIPAKEVDYGHLIIGPSRDDASVTVVWTWFPGDVTAWIDSTLCTVKLAG